MNSTSHKTLIYILLTNNRRKKISCCSPRKNILITRMPSLILDRSIDWIAGNFGQHIQLTFLGNHDHNQNLEFELIEQAILRCRKWEKCHPIQFTFTMAITPLDITAQAIEKFMDWDMKYQLSIDGYGACYRRSYAAQVIEKQFEIIQERFHLLKEYHQKPIVHITVFPNLIHRLRSDLAQLQQIGITSFIISPATEIWWSKENLQAYSDELVAFAAVRPTKNGQQTPSIFPIDDPVQEKNAWGCAAERSHFSINPQGKICTHTRKACLNQSNCLVFGDVFKGIDLGEQTRKTQEGTDTSRLDCAACALRGEVRDNHTAFNGETLQSPIQPVPEECRMERTLKEIRQRIASKQATVVV